jgi:hypothetical protein
LICKAPPGVARQRDQGVSNHLSLRRQEGQTPKRKTSLSSVMEPRGQWKATFFVYPTVICH